VDPTRRSEPLETFTSRLPAGWSPFPLLGITTVVTGRFHRQDFHLQERQLASLHQKDQKVGKDEDGSEPAIGARDLAAPRPSTPLAAAPSTFLIFPIFLLAFLSFCALHPSIRWNRATSLATSSPALRQCRGAAHAACAATPAHARARVPYYWLVDPDARTLEALRLDAVTHGWMEVGAYGDEAIARIAPFEAIQLEVSRLFPPAAGDSGTP